MQVRQELRWKYLPWQACPSFTAKYPGRAACKSTELTENTPCSWIREAVLTWMGSSLITVCCWWILQGHIMVKATSAQSKFRVWYKPDLQNAQHSQFILLKMYCCTCSVHSTKAKKPTKQIKPKGCFSTGKLNFCPSGTPRYLSVEEFLKKTPKTKDTVIALRYKQRSKTVVTKTQQAFTYSTLYYMRLILLSSNPTGRYY